ncbi:DNA polymerase II large subunit [Candidatus Micrarchaeota archaeon]|nr:DNA polymerase II large subunit [Candidatus Micrarchaeota archaeon]
MPQASEKMQEYFSELELKFSESWNIASKAREKHLDPADHIETRPAKDIFSRVEGLVGPVGIAARIEQINEGKTREEIIFQIVREICEESAYHPKYTSEIERKEKLLEQAVRTGLAIFTEGVVSAPIEGISQVKLKKNQDGTDFAAVYFAGPIRGAGGTGQAFTVLLADYARQVLKIPNYRPSETEIERYIEESNLYAIKTRAGQYVPTSDEIRHIISNCAVCIAGEPTEDYEVNVNKDTYNVESNRVRGGMCLVVSEGICLKAAKVLKLSKKFHLQWEWLEALIKVAKKAATTMEMKPMTKYIDEIVAGRPIFAYPMQAGGFRMRYGRTRFTGIASKAVHPATMRLLNSFLAFGTQMKIERPGKGCIVTPCSSIDGPIVKLKSGEVRQLETEKEAIEMHSQVDKILFLGDLLVNYGDFLKSNHPLVLSAWCDEWYGAELESKGDKKTDAQLKAMSYDEAFSLAKKHQIALAPKYTFHWHDLTSEEMKNLAQFLTEGKVQKEWFDFKGFRLGILDGKPNRKDLLEKLCIPHKFENNTIIIEKNNALALLKTLGIYQDNLSMNRFNEIYKEGMDAMELVNLLSGIKIQKKVGIYIGASLGRPEKAKERKMKPPVQSLFPIGEWGGKLRGLMKANKMLKEKGNGMIEIETEISICPICGKKVFGRICRTCNEIAERRSRCMNEKCGRVGGADENMCYKCHSTMQKYEKAVINFSEEFEKAVLKTEYRGEEIKGVQGLISATRTPESIEKGLLRAKHGLSVFRDGTCRFDATEIPTTHFIPSEIGIALEQVRELGYEIDVDGKAIVSLDQVVEMKAQDIILSEYAGDYFVRISKFMDDLLVYQYGMKAYYKAETRKDMIGKLAIGIAPHTSAGILCRIIGFSDIRGVIAHPFLHCAARRNCDGDELSYILLMDALINFSKFYLPQTRGGQMDALLVLTTILDPNEIDDEAHAMDCVPSYPLEFYEATQRMVAPSEVKIEKIGDRLETNAQYENINYTHFAKLEGPTETRYVQLTNMKEKVDEELELMGRINAVDVRNACERIILSHFFPDLYGNLRRFSKQKFRCVDCTAKFRRVPLVGKCSRCGGKLLLTVNKGGIIKYLELSKSLVDKYELPNYLKQRLMLIEREIQSIFEDQKVKQFSLAEYA